MLGCNSWLLVDNRTEHDSVENWGHWAFCQAAEENSFPDPWSSHVLYD